jgi:hypothetical protein
VAADHLVTIKEGAGIVNSEKYPSDTAR